MRPVPFWTTLDMSRRVLRADVLVIEMYELAEAEDILIELHPGIHHAFLDIADDVVDAARSPT